MLTFLTVSYGDGSSTSGDVYADTVQIGGITATSQAVEAATSVASVFTGDSAKDGLAGFAFSTINTVTPQKQNTWFDNIKSSLSQQLFAVTLKHQAAGTYDFGFIDSSKYTGSIAYTPVDNSQGYWGFTADGYSVGGTATTESFQAIADTGTSLIYLPDDIVNTYYSAVSGAIGSDGSYTFPCASTLPDLGISIGGQLAVVPGSYLNYNQQDATTCFGGLQSSSAVGSNILGDVFLKSQYVVFDEGNLQLGFAAQATVAPPSNATYTLKRAIPPRVAAGAPRLDFFRG